MQLLQDGVIAALAAVGLATIVWFTVTALTHPRERVRSETAVIVPARGAAETLEHTVRTLESERYASGGFSRCLKRVYLEDFRRQPLLFGTLNGFLKSKGLPAEQLLNLS